MNLHRQAGAYYLTTMGEKKADVIDSDDQATSTPTPAIKSIDAMVGEETYRRAARGRGHRPGRHRLFRHPRRAACFFSRPAGGECIAVTSIPDRYGRLAARLRTRRHGRSTPSSAFSRTWTRAERAGRVQRWGSPRRCPETASTSKYVDFHRERGPALVSSVHAVRRGMVGNEVLRLLLKRGRALRRARMPRTSTRWPSRYDVTQRPRGRGFRAWLLRRMAFLLYPGLRRLHDDETR